MRVFSATTALLCLLMLTASSKAADNSGRIYGKIYTVDNDIYEGYIRWDKNEGSWVDLLNGTKDRENSRHTSARKGRKKYGDHRTSIKFFGIKIGESDNDFFLSSSAEAGIRFGHIKELEVIDDDRVRLLLKSGEEIELRDGSTDIGSGIREIVIEDQDEGEIEFSWDDIDRIVFSQADGDEPSNFGERLYGTVTTRRGDKFTGTVCWDVDEIFTTDILDGDDKRRSRKIKFGKIKSIERYSSSGAEIVLVSGDEMLLRGSNDVDSDNRGIIIGDPGFGQVTVKWDEFERVDFSSPANQVKYAAFDGGHLLKGTVYTEDNESYTGIIRWDDDEEFSWETLDGEYRDVEYDIEFGLVKLIEKRSYRGATVTVWDGREFRLRGSNDVDDGNKGIFVLLDDGDKVEVDWEDFERVEFVR